MSQSQENRGGKEGKDQIRVRSSRRPVIPPPYAKQVEENLRNVKYKIAVISGKGGVGKSFVSAAIALALARLGYKTGLLDIDIHGPSIPKILGIRGFKPYAIEGKIEPIQLAENLKVLSLELLLEDINKPVVWRGPLKSKAITELLYLARWGSLDYLVFDLPPGTGDEPLSIAQLVPNPRGAIIVTTPSSLAGTVVRKAVEFCLELELPILGIVKNMSYFKCPVCGTKHRIFGEGAAKEVAETYNLEILAEIPIHLDLSKALDTGTLPQLILYQENHEVTQTIIKLAQRIARKASQQQ